MNLKAKSLLMPASRWAHRNRIFALLVALIVVVGLFILKHSFLLVDQYDDSSDYLPKRSDVANAELRDWLDYVPMEPVEEHHLLKEVGYGVNGTSERSLKAKGYNSLLSDQMPLDRPLADVRHPK